VYVIVTLVFYGLMLDYARACEHLGKGGTGEEERP
jgi:hypothetical protein